MTFWIIAAGAALILAFFLFRTLISPVPTDEIETQLAIYKDQLSEIERDEARGTLTTEEAKRPQLVVDGSRALKHLPVHRPRRDVEGTRVPTEVRRGGAERRRAWARPRRGGASP